MGVLYTIAPLDELIAEYLRDVGVVVPKWSIPGRDPSPQKLRTVCTGLIDLKVQVFSPPAWDAGKHIGWEDTDEYDDAPEKP